MRFRPGTHLENNNGRRGLRSARGKRKNERVTVGEILAGDKRRKGKDRIRGKGGSITHANSRSKFKEKVELRQHSSA